MSLRLAKKVAEFRQTSPDQAKATLEHDRMAAWRSTAGTAALALIDMKLHGTNQVAVGFATAVATVKTSYDIEEGTMGTFAFRLAFRPNSVVRRVASTQADAQEAEAQRKGKVAWRSVAMVTGTLIAAVATKGRTQEVLDGTAILMGLHTAARAEEANIARRRVYGSVFRRTG